MGFPGVAVSTVLNTSLETPPTVLTEPVGTPKPAVDQAAVSLSVIVNDP